MTRPLRILCWGLALVLLCGAMLVAGALAIGDSLSHAHIVINGESVDAGDFGTANGLLALGGGALGLLVVTVVLLALLPLLIAALLLGGALFLVSGVAAVLCSPLLVLAGLGWLGWRLLRGTAPASARAPNDAPAPGTARPGATIAR